MEKVGSGSRLSRRLFLKTEGAVVLAAAALSGCDFWSTESDQASGGVVEDRTKGPEAPELAARVDAGELPPVAERLPVNPPVVEPLERMGKYGGQLTTVLPHPTEGGYMSLHMGYEPLVRWDADWEQVLPNVAESYEIGDQGAEYTFRLREGMKWSDGEPFTADDIVFVYDDVFSNEELSPGGPPGIFVSGDQPAEVSKVDDYTVVFTFAQPNGLFLQQLATPDGLQLLTNPRHYLEQFHADYNADVEDVVAEEGVEDWADLFQSKGGGISNMHNALYQNHVPTLHPWIVTSFLGEGERAVVERNPYYWKVDPDGSQLPYLDRVIFNITEDLEVLLLNILQGEIDLQVRHFNTLQNKPVVSQSRDEGDYRIFDLVRGEMNTTVIGFNLTHEDSALQAVFANRDFRVGLSHAINRDEIIDVVYRRQGEPWQAAPRPESPFHYEELAKQYLEYDVDLANQYLDQAGYVERDGQGFRLRPDGARISFVAEYPGTVVPEDPDVLELVKGYWEAVGVELNISHASRELYRERRDANQHDVALSMGKGGLDVLLQPTFYLPLNSESVFGVPWAQWRLSGGAEGAEPPASARRQIELYDELRMTVDEDEQADLMREILQIAREEFYVLGINLAPDLYGIVKNHVRNVPETMRLAWLHGSPGPTYPEQYFVGPDE